MPTQCVILLDIGRCQVNGGWNPGWDDPMKGIVPTSSPERWRVSMCGIVGIMGVEPVNVRLYDALTVLQHRGQDAAGIATAGELPDPQPKRERTRQRCL